jgi:hypothetical protein
MSVRTIMAVATSAVAALSACQHDAVSRGAPSPPTTAAAAAPSNATPLDRVALEWLLSPIPTCPPPQATLLIPSDDPILALLQVLGLAPNTTDSSCPPRPAAP